MVPFSKTRKKQAKLLEQKSHGMFLFYFFGHKTKAKREKINCLHCSVPPGYHKIPDGITVTLHFNVSLHCSLTSHGQ